MNFVCNDKEHGVSFKEASTVFLDVLSITGADPDHSESEERWLTFGVSIQGNFLVVSHTDEGETIRIISARLGEKSERKLYEEG
ncbi:MAG TPA: BrnT family toxin [Rhodocyclaceae bacterium]|nr:BrnT family toxin [Rhodocyclaceae bacterium]